MKALVDACTRHNIKRFLHLSALGANQATGTSRYLRSKGEGENLLHTFGQKDLHVTSFQPSVVFGKNDQFINQFAGILKLCFGFFPLACAQSKLAPVYVGDLVEKIVNAVDDKSTHSQRYTVCGPEVFSLQQILELLVKAMGSSCRIVPLGNFASKLQARLLQNLPGKLFTMDNYRSLQTPSVCEGGELCTTSLGQYIKNIDSLFSNKRHYDRFRQQIPR
jgi:NADH dehydrogenase